MALSDFVLSPLGLLALASVIPVILLYLIRPDPMEVDLPTLRFLVEQTRQDTTNPLLEQLRRNLLLFLQIAVLVLLAVSLASPYVTVSEESTVEETVLVVDTSASMATEAGGDTRFGQALASARSAVSGTTSVVVTAPDADVALRGGTADEARTTLDGLAPTATEGNLRAAISQATAVAGENARIVVVGDFADDTDWQSAVETARARDLLVELRQFAGGGTDNVGIVDRRFSGTEVTVSVKNFGDSEATRQLQLGQQTATVTLEPDDVTTRTFTVPAGASEVRLTPGDSFPTDDRLPLSAPEDPTVDVLVLTNDRNRYLTTALSVIDDVELTVKNPPTAVSEEYDVIVYSNVDPDELLPGNVAAGRETVERGGGVAIQAQEPFPSQYGDLLLIEPGQLRTGSTTQIRAQTELTRGIDFQAPTEYVDGTLREGTLQVAVNDGDPLLATADRGEGRLLYYGYIEASSSFKFNYQYPVFWKRAVFYLADRETLPTLNRETGGSLDFTAERRVETPSGSVSATTVPLTEVGLYRIGSATGGGEGQQTTTTPTAGDGAGPGAGDTSADTGVEGRRIAVALLSEPESTVTAPDVAGGEAGVRARTEERSVPDPITEYLALGALVVALGELAYLRRRGDL
ncbi:vWA domain-containing protein [Salinirubrum litoreum]|uniref:BatA domain-containing protein n=1 Tax=Salinirubrum litoreum TaxID=1126234 RepID=A0ABD5R732_9EURY|nr:BatA and WFA domain-containing protein [Salinirubrum litoreum]